MTRTDTHDYYERLSTGLFDAILETAPGMLLRRPGSTRVAILASDLTILVLGWPDWYWAAYDAGHWETLNTDRGELLALVADPHPQDDWG